VIRQLKAKGIPLVSDIEFAARFSRAKKVCITGSNGKTTTTLLIYHLLKKAGLDVGLGGNVGKSLARQIAEKDRDVFVIEVSSFQLDYMFEFRADVAVMTNITPDHLDRYDNDFSRYAASKFRLLQNMDSGCSVVYWDDDPLLSKQVPLLSNDSALFPYAITKSVNGNGARISGNEIIIEINSKTINMTLENLALQGKHNLCNSMAAGIVGRLFEIRKDVIKESLSDFQGVEHRLELVARVHGIEFINDSKATNVNATWYALESMTKPVIWIVGGIDKGNDYSSLKPLVKSKVKAIVCLGLNNERVHKEFGKDVPLIADAASAAEAVEAAYNMGRSGDTVLLSPACASFDLFENYEDRGLKFKKAVFDL
jgi:UDP-N-acetylmuramoylalanine--D-glutamate ligase